MIDTQHGVAHAAIVVIRIWGAAALIVLLRDTWRFLADRFR